MNPDIGDLVVLLYTGSSSSRLALATVDDEKPDPHRDDENDEPVYDITVHYDTADVVETPNEMENIQRNFITAVLDDEEWREEFGELLDTARQILTLEDIAEVLAGDTHLAHGEMGYEALRKCLLMGISESITANSISHGHGPSRYGRSVESTLEHADYPDFLIDTALSSERDRWEGGMPFTSEDAAYVVEVLQLREQFLDEDNEGEITDLVTEYDLEYDEYREVEGGDLDD